jgi:5-formyltetrahydrofolate cyclo-ligase
MSDKERLRRAIRASLAGLSPELGRSAGARVAEQLASAGAFEQCSQVVLFASLPGEPDTGPIFAAARAAGRLCLLPRMLQDVDLEFVLVDDFGALVAGRYGVREPASAAPPQEVAGGSLVLVPRLAFDHDGGRLGRGAGYYDRALARIRSRAGGSRIVGVAFDVQLVDRVPMDSHDVRIDGVVTESGLVWTDPVRATAIATSEQRDAENDD